MTTAKDARRRRSSETRFRAAASLRACSAALLLLLALPAAASAYTLVLRSGRQVVVPDAFTVTTSAVVYEPAPGFSATVWLSNIDVAATERANNEPAGSFARRIGRGRVRSEAAAAAARPANRPAPPSASERKAVTNRELESSRLKREAQEEEYERTRRERGLPSKEELQKQVEEQDRRLRELIAELEASRREAEIQALRAELSAVRSNLNVLNSQLSQASAAFGAPLAAPGYYPYYYPPVVQVIGDLPFGARRHFGHGGFGLRGHFRWPFNTRFDSRFNSHAGRHRPPINVLPGRVTFPAPRPTMPPRRR